MATIVNDNYRNAVVGTLIFVNDEGYVVNVYDRLIEVLEGWDYE